MPPLQIDSARLHMIAATPELLQADLQGLDPLQAALSRYLDGSAAGEVRIPASWPPPYSDEMRRYVLDRLRERSDLYGWTLWYIVTREPGEPPRAVGYICFANGPDAEGTIEIGGFVLEEEQSRGYASEASDALGRWAFTQGIRRLTANTLAGYAPTRKLLERNGYRYIGETLDQGIPHAQYELLPEDLPPRRSPGPGAQASEG